MMEFGFFRFTKRVSRVRSAMGFNEDCICPLECKDIGYTFFSNKFSTDS
jgi:hypothetical protein